MLLVRNYVITVLFIDIPFYCSFIYSRLITLLNSYLCTHTCVYMCTCVWVCVWGFDLLTGPTTEYGH